MRYTAWKKSVGSLLGLSLALASSCAEVEETNTGGTQTGGGPPTTVSVGGEGGAGGGGGINWNEGGGPAKCEVDELLDTTVAGAKAKTLLTGLALEDSEYVTLRDESEPLPQLIDGWLALPEASETLRRFFMTALQQDGSNRENFLNLIGRNDVTLGRFRDGLPPGYPSNSGPSMDIMFNRVLGESMARTAVEYVNKGVPFNTVVDTDSFMMTSAMMAFLAFTDDNVVGDDKSHSLRTSVGHFDTIRLVRDKADAPPASEALDPKHPNFGVFHHPNLAQMPLAACGETSVPKEIVVEGKPPVSGQWRVTLANMSSYAFTAIAFGRVDRITRFNTPGCVIPASAQGEPLLAFEDFSDWREVTVRKPVGDGASADLFYDMTKLRSAKELVVHTPRRGFLSHPGFFGTWMTNEDNGSRVTVNQSLIVALGKTFESSILANYDPPNVDQEHAGDPECYGCHQTLDPMRDLMRGSFTNYYGQQLDPDRKDMPTDFIFGGESGQGSGIDTLVEQIADHPALPLAWVQKLCFFANAQACPEGEELDRVVEAFTSAELDFRVLIRELFSSPLVTGTSCIPGLTPGTTATISRRSTFCNQLSRRTGVEDLCGLRTEPQAQSQLQKDVAPAVDSVPDDSYSRDEVAPVTIAETGLFIRANREAACNLLAFKSVPILFNGYTNPATEEQVTEGLEKLVEDLMGLPPSDPRHGPAMKILRDHVDEIAVYIPEGSAGPLGSLIGLISAVPIACMAPSSAGIGF